MDTHLAAGPLASATGAAVFNALSDHREPMATEALAGRLGLHPNSVRYQLAKLACAGLVERESVPGPRGRPHHEWSIAPDAAPANEPPAAYAELAAFLSDAIDSQPGAAERVEAAGREIGRGIAPNADHGTAADVLEHALAAMGFAPDRGDVKRRTRFTLHNCPYLEVAKRNPGVVCTLHRGIARGLVEAAEPGAALTDFVIRRPERAGCLIEIQAPAPPARERSHDG